MSQCVGGDEDDEKNRKNSHILKQNIFKHDICKILRFAFDLYNRTRHYETSLVEVITLTHAFLQMLEDYSKGKVMTIQTDKTRRRKKQKKRAADEDAGFAQGEGSGDDGNFDPQKPDEPENNEEEGGYHDSEEDEESEEEQVV